MQEEDYSMDLPGKEKYNSFCGWTWEGMDRSESDLVRRMEEKIVGMWSIRDRSGKLVQWILPGIYKGDSSEGY